jgi:MYXO-CTERM domain-containing protein
MNKTIGVSFDNTSAGFVGLDNVVLTVTSVPEPSTLGLGALAIAGLAGLRRRR